MRVITLLVAAMLLLAVTAVVVAGVVADRLTASAVEESTENALGVPAALGGASVGVLTGSFVLTDLRVSNPEGFEAPEVVRLGRGEGRIRLSTLFSEVVELPRVTLSDGDLHLERREGSGNYEPILVHYIEEGRHLGDPDRRYIIGELVVRDVTLHLDLLPEVGEEARLSVPLDELRLAGVGEEEAGLMLQEVVGVVTEALVEAALERAAEELPGVVLRGLLDRLPRFDPSSP